MGDLGNSDTQRRREKKSRETEKIARTCFLAALIITGSKMYFYGLAIFSSSFQLYITFIFHKF